MSFAEFMLRPFNEFELFILLANEVQENYSRYHGSSYYLHLTDAGDRQSIMDEVHSLESKESPWHFVYIERDRQACILVRSDEASITMVLYGEYNSGYLKVTSERIHLHYGPNKSTLPGARRSPLNAMQTMEAFGLVPGVPHAFKVK